MLVIELLLIIILLCVFLFVIYYFIKKKHVHKFKYSYSTDEHHWFYCEECMIQGYVVVDNSGVLSIQYFNTKQGWKTYGKN